MRTNKKTYRYATCCVNSTAAKIDAMVAEAREVTYRTIARHCAGLEEWARANLYDTGTDRGGLRLKNDWAVTYFKSRYGGKPCYYICHSCIEYIWILAD